MDRIIQEDVSLVGRKGGEVEAGVDTGFDLSGMADLETTETETAEEETSAESTEAAEDETAEVETETESEAAKEETPAFRAKVGNREYDNPDDVVKDYDQLQREFTQTQQKLRELESKSAPAQAADTAPDPEAIDPDTGLTYGQLQAMEKIMGKVAPKLGFVRKEEIEAQENVREFKANVKSFISDHNGADGLAKVEERPFLEYLRDHPGYNLEDAYQLMYGKQNLQKMAQDMLKKKVKPVNSERSAPSSGRIPPEAQGTVDFDNMDTMRAAVNGALGK